MVAVYLVSLMIDSQYDKKSCREMISFVEGEIRCYANDDMKHLNFGRNIDCTCFTGEYEELNLQMIKFIKIDKDMVKING